MMMMTIMMLTTIIEGNNQFTVYGLDSAQRVYSRAYIIHKYRRIESIGYTEPMNCTTEHILFVK